MASVRIGFVGAGNMGQCAHLRNYATIPDCEVVALAEIRPRLRERVAARYGIPRVYADHIELLDAEELDGIVAPQPFTRHGTLVPELLQAGIPIFIEKPLAGSIEMGKRILAAVESSGAWLMVGYHKRSDPAVMWAKKEMQSLHETGELGALAYVRITMPAGDWVAGGFSDLIRTDEPLPALASDPVPCDLAEADYRAYLQFVNYYIHQVNLMRHLLGEPYRVAYADPSGVLLVVESQSGIAGTIEMSPYRTSVDWQESALVAFERGYIRIDLPAPLASNRPGRVKVLRDPGDEVTPQTISPQLPWVHAMRQQAIHFVRAIKGEGEPLCTAQEALQDLEVARDYLGLLKGK